MNPVFRNDSRGCFFAALVLTLTACGTSANNPSPPSDAQTADLLAVDGSASPPDASAPPADVVEDRATTTDAPREAGTPSECSGGGCGPHGHSHGDHCHCDEGYVERAMCCVRAPPCSMPDDALEENDDAMTATSIENGRAEHQGLRVCPADRDVFRVPARAGQRVRATARFRHADGDIDMYLFTPGTTDLGHAMPVASSDGTRDNESITYTAAREGDHLLVVLGYNGAENRYELEVNVTDP